MTSDFINNQEVRDKSVTNCTIFKKNGVTEAVLLHQLEQLKLMNIGYAKLRDNVASISASAQVQKNLKSALSQWIDCFALSYDSQPEKHFGDEFENTLEVFRTYLKGRGVTDSTRNDRLTLIRAWRRLYLEQRLEITSPSDFGGALKEAFQNSGITMTNLTRSIGLGQKTFRDWLSGMCVPNRRSEKKLHKLEEALRLPPNFLSSRISSFYGDLPEYASIGLRMTPHRESLIWARENPYRLHSLPDSLRDEWFQLLRYKTQILPRGMHRSSSWATKHKDEVPDIYSSYVTIGNQVCPTAELNFDRLTNFFGYVVLPHAKGGKGLGGKALTLATLADSNLMVDHLEFLKERSGNFNGSTKSIIGLVRNLLRPEYGYLWQNHAFGKKYIHGPLNKDDWQSTCAEAFHHLGEVSRHLNTTGQITKSRFPEQPIQNILDRQHPISALFELIDTMEAKAPPPCWEGRLAVFKRDLLLIKLITVNPLRAKNWCIMTYRKDNSGHLHQKPDDSWWLRFKPSDFKNQRGAAKTQYEVRLSPSVWSDIEEYLSKYRPLLAGASETDYVLRPKVQAFKKGGSKKMMTPAQIGAQVQKWTRLMLPGCPGFRLHAFRHIVATDYIKNHPQSYFIAAVVLHDKIETVVNEYAHLKKSDDFEVYNSYLEKVRAMV